MAKHFNKDDRSEKREVEPALKPDPETLGTTDPQEHMKGPVSSLVHKVEKSMGKNDEDDKNDENDNNAKGK